MAKTEISDWLITEGPRAQGVPGLLVGLLQLLNGRGLEIFRSSLMVRTLHPEIESIRFGWVADFVEMPPVGRPFFLKKRYTRIGSESVEEISFSHGAFARSEPYQVSPYKKIDLGAAEVHSKVTPGEPEFPIIADIASVGGTDYFLYALPKLGDLSHCISFSTKIPGGFSEDHLGLFRAIAAPLAAALEIQVNRLITEDLMAVYLGLLPAQKVLAGKIQPGDVDAISSAIWFSDLRGYTDLSQVVDCATLIRWLNGYFEAISAPIIENGGEILKYMGDAVLAVFPVEQGDAHRAACGALAAAREANAALAAFNEQRAAASLPVIRHGIALHIGDVQYGNIGANRRLDFTVIGPEVNKASRIEGLCKETGKSLLLSQDFASHVPGAQLVGSFQLKGIQQSEKIFAVE